MSMRAREPAKAITIERIPDPFAPPVALDQTCFAENLQVMGDGRLTLAQRLDEVTDADLALGRSGQNAQYSESDWIGQCTEPSGQLIGFG